MEEQILKEKRKVRILCVFLGIMFLIVIGLSYAWLRTTVKQKDFQF